MSTKNLLVELFVEELPPKALKKLGDAFAEAIWRSLDDQLLIVPSATIAVVESEPDFVSFIAYASPRRLAVHITGVATKAPDRLERKKVVPVSVGLDLTGLPSPALNKRMFAAFGIEPSETERLVSALNASTLQQLQSAANELPERKLSRALEGKVEELFFTRVIEGVTLVEGLQKALLEAIAKLPIPKVMSYQLETDCDLPGWSSVSFVRPAHGLVALHGADVVPVQALGLKAGNSTHGHRFEAAFDAVVLKDADSYAATLLKDGAVIASFAERKEEIRHQLINRAPENCFPIDSGGDIDDALLDEVTALVERPNVLVCEFEKEFLDVPQECLILTMKANQKYFPLLDAAGKLTNKFLVVSNITPADTSFVIGGNERVVRPRLADAKFFFDQDRKKTLASRVEGLGKVVYHNKLGSQGERVERVRAIAKAIGQQLGGEALALKADLAAQLAKTDLVTDMVGEFPELQGTMGRYYALNDGLSAEVADAIEDHYKPRFAGDELPRNATGTVVALADKLETLLGMFKIGNLPTGDKDPFALRRHALGVIRLLIEKDLPLELDSLLKNAAPELEQGLDKFFEGADSPKYFKNLIPFIYERLAGSLREQGYSAQEVDAVLTLHPQRLGNVAKRLQAVRAFTALPEAPALAAANKRIGNILKKTDNVDAHVSEVLLTEPAEIALHTAMKNTVPKANAQFEAGDYTASLQTLAALRAPVDAFFEGVMVNAERIDLRLNRLGLLATLHVAMNRVADLSKLAA